MTSALQNMLKLVFPRSWCFFRSSVARVVERAVARRLEAEDGWRDALVELGPRKAEPAEPGRRSQKFD